MGSIRSDRSSGLPMAGTFVHLNLLRDEAPERLDTTPAVAGR